MEGRDHAVKEPLVKTEIRAVWTGEGGLPEELTGSGPKRHSKLSDEAQERKKEVFSIRRGNGEHYIDLSKLYNVEGTGYCQQLIPKNMETYRKGYEELARRRESLKP